MMAAEPDGRRARGDRTRHKAARYAADLATVYGLDSISVGQLAAGTGLSKSGILTVFDGREAIQLAAIAEARAIFIAEVVTPAWHLEPGVVRLRAFVDNWLTYVRARVFPGGCFLAATSAEYAGRDGEVADAVRALKQDWLRLLESQLLAGGPDGETERNRARRIAFQL
ncbi:TetR/AcrR family transcriptional regulator, partial [Aldersonia kunmingensis]|uniref:TetR/AcrR family transcriptional regulator n=1 Tax=Aldersonia kunmingensis TaxID=408066 RepID=UPI000ACF3B10